jgi:hypothetical protein
MKNDDVQKAVSGWEKLLNPEVLKTNLMFVATFLAAYEMLKNDCLVERVRSFYTHGFDENGLRISPDYQTRVRDRDKSLMKASALWFEDLGAITQDDLNLLDRLREYRNEIAHNLTKIILSSEGEFKIDLFSSMLLLIKKIDIYWIRNVEMDCDENLIGREISDDEISSGNMIVLHLLMQAAFGDKSKAKDFYDRFKSGLEIDPSTSSG